MLLPGCSCLLPVGQSCAERDAGNIARKGRAGTPGPRTQGRPQVSVLCEQLPVRYARAFPGAAYRHCCDRINGTGSSDRTRTHPMRARKRRWLSGAGGRRGVRRVVIRSQGRQPWWAWLLPWQMINEALIHRSRGPEGDRRANGGAGTGKEGRKGAADGRTVARDKPRRLPCPLAAGFPARNPRPRRQLPVLSPRIKSHSSPAPFFVLLSSGPRPRTP
jgi:hypothetical protein